MFHATPSIALGDEAGSYMKVCKSCVAILVLVYFKNGSKMVPCATVDGSVDTY